MTNRRRIITAVAAPVVIGTIWASGVFDHQLASAGLNAKPCGTNLIGVTFCGKELEAVQTIAADNAREAEAARLEMESEERQAEYAAEREAEAYEAKAAKQRRIDRREEKELEEQQAADEAQAQAESDRIDREAQKDRTSSTPRSRRTKPKAMPSPRRLQL